MQQGLSISSTATRSSIVLRSFLIRTTRRSITGRRSSCLVPARDDRCAVPEWLSFSGINREKNAFCRASRQNHMCFSLQDASRPMTTPLVNMFSVPATEVCESSKGILRVARKHFSSVAPNEIRGGNYIIHNGHYCEVRENKQIKRGRGASSYAVEFYDLNDRKISAQKFSTGQKIERIEITRSNVQVMQVDSHGQRLIAIDENFEDVVIPFEALGELENETKNLAIGTALMVVSYKGHIIKAQARPHVKN
eukprot:GHVQ01027077.1.p1 GENE.GHVQ01027077.1~~GHVQ01027077.1.p1  ORF type:complete len:251 (-),score=12.11 GHVQ01027077.1:967-1719(-)